ncbi:FAD-dependent oxidoreductase [Bathymodiolus japonicus methanotrophic gill symbiont]|uniref:FAD-dependent oxidoreductase n=1 Tax=Bathymodiolus japonicus methanotrophic gill symbiont TaxID=113269 RepID=UPI001C8F1BC6|nr:FAD-dependent oxidoreductase [Bathymodiolus japonicus methanotrophic gill symbiont]
MIFYTNIRFLRQNHNINLQLGQAVESFKPTANGLEVRYSNGYIETDMVLLAIGVVPESSLAKQAGLQLSERGAIQVNA